MNDVISPLAPTLPVSAPAPAAVRKPVRKSFAVRLWQLHSWLGLVCGLGLILIGLTGSLLVFHDEIDARRFPGLHFVQPSPAGRLSYDALWASLRRALPDEKITGWVPAVPPDRADAIFVSREGEEEPRMLHVNPYTGQVLGTPVEIDHTLTGWLLELHYSFLGGTVGTLIAGLLGVGLLVLGVSGVWMYRKFWRHFFTLRWGKSTRIFFSDLHKMVGISSTVFNLILGFTGAWWNLTGVYARWAAPAAAPAAAPKAVAQPFDFAADGLSLDALLARADRELPGYRPMYMWLPAAREGLITFYGTVPTPNPLRGDYGSRVVFNAPAGTLKEVVDIRKAGFWTKVGDSFVLLHFGTFGAVFGRGWDVAAKTAWTVLGLTPGVLAVSGFMIWRSRRTRKVAG